MTTLRIGSLFSGYGGLDMGVQAHLGGELAWYSEIEPAAVKVLRHHHPGVPNLGDITTVDWSQAEPVDVLTGGFPCQDVSSAGRRVGMRPGTRSGLWSHMRYAISQLRPPLVVIENVRGLLSADAHCDLEPCPWCLGDNEGRPLRALGAVLGDLAGLGYVGRWHGLRASDVGAPHGRFRVFIAAWPAANSGGPRLQGWRELRPASGEGKVAALDRCATSYADSVRPTRTRRARAGRCGSADHDLAATHAQGDGRGEGWPEPAWLVGGPNAAVSGDGAATDPDCDGLQIAREGPEPHSRHDADGCGADSWGDYTPAIRRVGDKDDNLLGDRLSHETGRPGDVQEALHALADNRRPFGGKAERAETEVSGRTILGSGEQGWPDPSVPPRPGSMLDLDRSASERMGPRQVHGRRGPQHKGAPLGVRASGGHNSRRVDTGPSVPGSGMCEPVAPGTGDLGREPSQAGRGSHALPGQPSDVGGEPLSRPADGLPPLSDLPEQAQSELPGTQAINWGPYAPAIARWERILGQPAPAPTVTGQRGGQQLSPYFVEWLMGLPEGHVTAVPGLSRNEQLKLLGNGVVPRQASAALSRLLASTSERAA